LVFLGARRTSLEMSAHRRNHHVGVLASKLGFDIDVKEIEALLTGQLGARGA
jgi:hypothetical protein